MVDFTSSAQLNTKAFQRRAQFKAVIKPLKVFKCPLCLSRRMSISPRRPVTISVPSGFPNTNLIPCESSHDCSDTYTTNTNFYHPCQSSQWQQSEPDFCGPWYRCGISIYDLDVDSSAPAGDTPYVSLIFILFAKSCYAYYSLALPADSLDDNDFSEWLLTVASEVAVQSARFVSVAGITGPPQSGYTALYRTFRGMWNLRTLLLQLGGSDILDPTNTNWGSKDIKSTLQDHPVVIGQSALADFLGWKKGTLGVKRRTYGNVLSARWNAGRCKYAIRLLHLPTTYPVFSGDELWCIANIFEPYTQWLSIQILLSAIRMNIPLPWPPINNIQAAALTLTETSLQSTLTDLRNEGHIL